ncbi:hypothetical protein Ancab_004910, partial [Ancistrocladus abbreviatus]
MLSFNFLLSAFPAATIISLIISALGLLGSFIGVATGCFNLRKNQVNNWQILRWRKQNLEDLIEQLRQPMDGVVNPALSVWITKATMCASELNIDELQASTRGTCCPGIEAGLVIDKELRELKVLIADGQRIFGESATRGYIRREINFIGSAVEDVKGAIWEVVLEGEVGTICIHGIAGVGKTAIAAAINNQALRTPEHFDFVIWVDVSDGADLQRVQEDIARSISINLPPDSNINSRASILRNALTGKNRILLILDSMWQDSPPYDIGIPELTEGHKLIVTSRIHPMLKLMAVAKPFVIEPLTNKDGWTLFERELGADNLSKLSSEIMICRTKNAMQDLQGVPSAIKNLAQTLKNICQKNPRTPIDAKWKEELDCLSRSATFLENRNRPGSLEDMRINGRARLKELLEASLLKNASEVGKQEKLEAAVRASFMGNQLKALKLSGSYSFNSLSTLLLQGNSFDMNHDSDFFNGMSNLKILDLSHTDIASLPNSLSNLTNLRALLLRNCLHLRDLPALSNLNRLNVLDLSGTQLVQWPEDMDMLTKLRRLDLTQAKLDIFPAECICRYYQLEELLMMWDINSRGCVWGSNELRDWNGAFVEWLSDLGHLADLQLVFLNARVFNSYMYACPKTADGYAITTTCFKFFVSGFHSASVESKSQENSITVIGDHRIVLPESTLVLNLMNCPDDVRSLNMKGCFRDLTILDVFAFNGLKYLLTLDMWHSLRNLTKIRVRRCRNIVGITHPAEEANPRIISHSSLVELVLFDLQSLQSVHDGQALHFKKLTRIGVWMCGLLRLPDLHGVRGDNVIEIEGEREWWDAFQQHNPGIFDGCPIRFKEVPAPPNVSSSP